MPALPGSLPYTLAAIFNLCLRSVEARGEEKGAGLCNALDVSQQSVDIVAKRLCKALEYRPILSKWTCYPPGIMRRLKNRVAHVRMRKSRFDWIRSGVAHSRTQMSRFG
jgi:hypothetical protein